MFTKRKTGPELGSFITLIKILEKKLVIKTTPKRYKTPNLSSIISKGKYNKKIK
jgi:hypothetical protein